MDGLLHTGLLCPAPWTFFFVIGVRGKLLEVQQHRRHSGYQSSYSRVALLFLESLLYGAFCVLYIMSLWILICRQRHSERFASFWMAGVLTAMFVLAGTYLAFDVRHLVAAFADHNSTPGGTLRYLWGEGHDPSRNMDPVIFIIMTFLGDGFMTYRIFVVWNRKLISLVLPGLLLVGDLIAAGFVGNGLLWYETPKDFDSLLVPALHSRLIAYFAMTLLTNLAMTLLLLGRLWWHDRRAKRYHAPHGHSVHWRVMRTILHSEAAYSLGVVLNLAACAARSQLVLLTSCVPPPAHRHIKGAGEAMNDPARALACIAVNVHISRTVDMDSEQGTTCDDKTSACHGDSEEVSVDEHTVVAV
ncbi:hypothetical protein VTO73DRAFT_4220 [Trametes versicolor]